METDGARTEPYPGEIASVERRQDRLRMLTGDRADLLRVQQLRYEASFLGREPIWLRG